MKVSIVTICYNNELDIRHTIESVINQTYHNIEYIIVDGNSKDSTLNIVNEYSGHISKIISEPDKGIYDAINKGIKSATGDIVGLIHAGDELYDNNVIEKVAICFSESNIDALYGHSKILSEDGTKVVRINKSPEYNESLFRNGWFPSHQSFYAKRELFDKLGLYNLKYRIAADYELLFRFIYVNKVTVKLLDEYLIKFKVGGTSTKSVTNIINLNKECINAWHDNGIKMPFYTIPLKLLRKVKQILDARLNISN